MQQILSAGSASLLGGNGQEAFLRGELKSEAFGRGLWCKPANEVFVSRVCVKLNCPAALMVFRGDQLARHVRFTGSRRTLQNHVMPLVQKFSDGVVRNVRHQVMEPARSNLAGICLE